MAAWFCLAGGFKVNVFKVNVFKVNVFKVNVFKVNGYFVLPFGPPEQGRQSPRPCTPAIRQTQPPAKGGFPQQKHFPDGPGAIRSQLNAPSRRIPAARPGKRFSLGGGDAS
ncbi:hypothetical protein [Duffyella gerundensis]|uniref:hypothetical protein n=2 Tax=Duffyella gerundensis TaxID=1619313 RepID=UPI001653FFB9|nr:hypothetical protein [Duffyella gerundensis]